MLNQPLIFMFFMNNFMYLFENFTNIHHPVEETAGFLI